MKYYMAPLEGITTYIFRNAYYDIFNDIDKYYAPFIVPQTKCKFKNKEYKDICPENNSKLHLVPQILSNNSSEFIRTANNLIELGYDEININLGCPAGTVVSKNKGSGFLIMLDELDRFLEDIYMNLNIKISIKTRIGKYDGGEFEDILKIYNKYPIYELIIHPRVQRDFYKNKPNMTMFSYGINNSINQVCYNGDIFSNADYIRIKNAYNNLCKVMIGRGLVSNPNIISEIKNSNINLSENKVNKFKKLKEFHNQILYGYTQELSGYNHVLHKMKELWQYFSWNFNGYEKEIKKINKTDKIEDYKVITDYLFSTQL